MVLLYRVVRQLVSILFVVDKFGENTSDPRGLTDNSAGSSSLGR